MTRKIFLLLIVVIMLLLVVIEFHKMEIYTLKNIHLRVYIHEHVFYLHEIIMLIR